MLASAVALGIWLIEAHAQDIKVVTYQLKNPPVIGVYQGVTK